MSDHDEIGHARALDDLVGHDADGHDGVGLDRFARGRFAERIEQAAPALLQRLTHLRRKVEIGLEAERPRDVVKERSLDRHDVDHVQPDHDTVQPFGEPERVLDGGARMLRAVETHENRLDHSRFRPCARCVLELGGIGTAGKAVRAFGAFAESAPV